MEIMHKWTFQREGPGTEMQGETKSEGRIEWRVGLSPISQAKKSQSGPPEGGREVEGAKGEF